MKFSTALASMAAAAMLVPGLAFAKDLEMRFQASYAPVHVCSQQVLIPWTEQMSKVEGLKVQFFPNNTIVASSEISKAVEDGMVEIGQVTPSFTPKDYPQVYSLSCPMLASSSAMGTEIALKKYAEDKKFKDEIDEKGVPLAFWYAGGSAFLSAKAPLRSPADFKGKRVMTPGANSIPDIEALGGVAVVVAPNELYVGLQRGMGEVVYAPIPFMKSFKLFEVAKYITPLPISGGIQMMLANRDVWDELNDAQKKAFEESTGRALSLKLAETLDNDTVNALKLFADNGVEVIELTDAERAEFQKIVDEKLIPGWIAINEKAGLKNAKEVVEANYKLAEQFKK
ncbi:MAG: TRAP transporter substrate-binding protein DctP [Mailhella sp.]|nr:TRAP transporter substrate-binding protein DctP [Mailhella sp.]